MSSKQITDREKSAIALLAIIEGQLEALFAASVKTLSPHLSPGEALPDLKPIFTLASRAVRQAIELKKQVKT